MIHLRSHLVRATAMMVSSMTAVGVLANVAVHPAAAAIAPGHLVAAQPMLDAMELDGFAPNSTLNVELVRNGVTIGTAAVQTDGAGNTLVNGDAATCWTGSTPDMLAGDIIRVNGTDTMPVDNSVITQPATVSSSGTNATVTVKGAAFTYDAAGNQVPKAAPDMEVRIIGGPFTGSTNRNRLIAPGDGTIEADPTGGPGAFIATWNITGTQNINAAQSGTTEVRSLDLTAGTQSTIIDNSGAAGGPIVPQCPAGASNGVATISPTLVSTANATSNVVVSGQAQDASSARITLTDSAAPAHSISVTVTPSPATAAQTWTATFTPAQLASLADGVVTASGVYTTPAGTISGATKTFTRDVTAPVAPTANPGAGTYTTTQSVTLNDVEAGVAIRFTADGSAPTATSALFAPATPITVAASKTLQAIAIDSAGNTSAVSSFVYTITPPAPAQSATTPAAQPVANGYRLIATDGGVFTFGNRGFFGSMGGSHLNAPIVTAAATPSGDGYWLVGADGGIFSFGDARFFGSTGGMKLNAPIVAMTPTPNGDGYWLVARDGGIFAFGAARYFGSMGGARLNAPIVSMATAPNGAGYWLVARDGGIFAFGNAGYFGSTGGIRLNQPIATMAATPNGDGYWLVARDGGIFTFGAARFLGSTGGMRLNATIVAMKLTSNGGGYWLTGQDGGIFAFGNAGFFGSTGGMRFNQPIITMA